MNTRKLLFALLLGFSIDLGAADDAGINVIFSDYDLPDTIYINRYTIQRIFTKKETRWSNGDNIIVFIKPMNSLEHKLFVSNVLNMTLYRYQKSLDAITYTAKGLPVIEVSNDAQMNTQILSHPGAIGYLNYQLVCKGKRVIICDDNCP